MALTAAEEAGDEAHDLPFDQAHRFRDTVHMPEFDFLGPGREPLLQHREVFRPLQGDDQRRPFQVVCQHLRW
jgi:hypothetical protein